jgi:hypothetical protein
MDRAIEDGPIINPIIKFIKYSIKWQQKKKQLI